MDASYKTPESMDSGVNEVSPAKFTDPLHSSTLESWQGWAELENDPLIFSALLREWRVPDIRVNEVVPMEAVFDTPVERTLGLIFLSRWVSPETENQVTQLPLNIWFANQTSSYSCATVAIMNILNNLTDIDLGPELNAFRQSTWAMSSKDRGLALDKLNIVRNVHNSFATKVDMMVVDSGLKQDLKKAQRKQKRSKRAKTSRKKTYHLEDDENGFHFVAYIPVGQQIWKMDGMEKMPRLLGTCEESSDWLSVAIANIQSQFDSIAANELEFSLLSLTHEVGPQVSQDELVRVQRLREDWGPFIAHMVKVHSEKDDLGQLCT